MMIDLSLVDSNPYRDFEVDPLDLQQVAALSRSIGRPGTKNPESSGFWGGILVRPADDRYQLVFGHHRLAALREMGWREADLNVVDFDDYKMVRVMHAENATQRKGVTTAIEAVGAAIRVLGPAIINNDLENVGKILPTLGTHSVQIQRGLLIAGKGLGREVIQAFLGDDFSEGAIRVALLSLNQSGKMTQYLQEMESQIDEEHLKDARIAAKKCAQRNPALLDPKLGSLFGSNFHAFNQAKNALLSHRGKEFIPLQDQTSTIKELIDRLAEMQEADRESVVLGGSEVKNSIGKAIFKWIDDGLRWLEDKDPEYAKETKEQKTWQKLTSGMMSMHAVINDFIEIVEEDGYHDIDDVDLGHEFRERISQLENDLRRLRTATSRVVSSQ